MNKYEPSENKKQKSDEKNDVGKSDPMPILSGNPPEIKTDNPKNKRNREKIKYLLGVIKKMFFIKKQTRRSLIVWLNIVMLIAFIVLGWCQNNKIQTSLKLTKTSNDNYERLTQADLRPYVVLEDIKPSEFRVGKTVKINIDFLNIGKTPAFCSPPVCGTFLFCNDSSRVDSLYKIVSMDLEKHNYFGNSIMGGNIPMRKIIERPQIFSREDSISIAIGTCKYCLLIGIIYNDQFNIRHHTYQCVLMSYVWGMEYYPKYNWAD